MLNSVTYACRSPVCRTFLSLQLTNRRWYLYQWLENSVHKRNLFLLSHNCLFNYNTRNFVAKINKVEKDDKPFRLSVPMGQREALQEKNIQILTKVLRCSKDEAESLIVNESELFDENFDVNINKVKLLVSEGITANAILNNIWILHVTLSRLQTYLQAMKLWGLDERNFQEFIIMFNETPKEFFYLSQKLIKEKATCPDGNRVIYIANRLDCSISEILSRILRKKFLFRKTIHSIERNLDLFEEFGIKKEDVVTDLSSVGGPYEAMRERLVKLKEIEYHPIKPWLARYDYAKYERAVKFFLAEKEAKDFESREIFLAAKLNVDVIDVTGMRREMYRKYPYLFHIRAFTFMKKLKFLLNEGYFPREIISNPYAFYPKINTLKDRINTLRKLGISKPSLPNVTTSEEKFELFLQNVLDDRGIKQSDKTCLDKD